MQKIIDQMSIYQIHLNHIDNKEDLKYLEY